MDVEIGGRADWWIEQRKSNIGVIRAVLQFVKATGRFQPRVTVVEDTGERDGEVGGSL